MDIAEDDYLAHYGILRKSGRYPWGSGGNVVNESNRSKTFLDQRDELRAKGMSDPEIAEWYGISTTDLRALNTMARTEQKLADIARAERLNAKGVGPTEGGRIMGVSESQYRALLAPGADVRAKSNLATADMLREAVNKNGFIDVGEGVETHLKVSKERLKVATSILKDQGYEVHVFKYKTPSGHEPTMKVLGPPGSTQKDAWLASREGKVQQLEQISPDHGQTWSKTHRPIPVDPKRVGVVYGPEGGSKADGVIYVRPGVEDVSLGGAQYSQVRIQVGDGHYLKGMAVYKNDLPDGIDLLFNTNKPKPESGNKLEVLKELEDNADYPFGSIVRPLIRDAGKPTEHVVSAMNIIREEGQWGDWSRNLSSQFLSKQAPELARRQLDMTYESRRDALKEIMSLTNPAVRKKLLEEYANSTDSAASHLKAASLPRARWHVILPVDKLSPTEVYAPGYNDGERVALVRYPHGGTFEIPDLIVNNKNRAAIASLGKNPRDAIGINWQVAERLSGADFDGDTVMVIPNNSGNLKITPALKRLQGFNPRERYPLPDSVPKMKDKTKGQQMGDISNLITDMTLKNASTEELARAVAHSMVVIDAQKHHLNYKQSAVDHGIRALKEKYQGKPTGGASTLISRRKSYTMEPQRKPRRYSKGGPTDPVTGRRVYEPTGKMRRDKDGNLVPVMEKVRKLDVTPDAHTLSSRTRMESIYADHSNRLKDLANKARLEVLKTPTVKRNDSAVKAYSREVASLDAKLAVADRKKPLERKANLLANQVVTAKKQANPTLDKDSIRKLQYQELERARAVVGVNRQKFDITDAEWAAIQAGAVSNHKLERILAKADVERIKQLASPKKIELMTPAKSTRAHNMLAQGYTRAQIAAALGVSISTLDRELYGEGDDD